MLAEFSRPRERPSSRPRTPKGCSAASPIPHAVSTQSWAMKTVPSSCGAPVP